MQPWVVVNHFASNLKYLVMPTFKHAHHQCPTPYSDCNSHVVFLKQIWRRGGIRLLLLFGVIEGGQPGM